MMIGKKKPRRSFCLIGFSEFNQKIGKMLMDEDVEITLLDKDREIVNNLDESLFSNVLAVDATQIKHLEEIKIREFDYVIVGIEDIETSISICSALKGLGIDRIFAKARNLVHERILRTMGIAHSFVPELQMVENVVFHTLHDVELNCLSFESEKEQESELFCLRLRVQNRNLNKEKITVVENSLPDYRVRVIAIKRKLTAEVIFPLSETDSFDLFDIVMVMAEKEAIGELKRLFTSGAPVKKDNEEEHEE